MNETRTSQIVKPRKVPQERKRGRGRPPLNVAGGDSATHNIRFSNRAWSRLRTIARRKKTAAADLVRQAVDEMIAEESAGPRSTR